MFNQRREMLSDYNLINKFDVNCDFLEYEIMSFRNQQNFERLQTSSAKTFDLTFH